MMDEEDDASKKSGRYKPGNVGPDGAYIVGKGKPPKQNQFAKGDGRRRGRRPKGQRNFDTEFQEEANRLVTVRENGEERRVTKLRTTIMRGFDNAASRGQNPAINLVWSHAARLADKIVPAAPGLSSAEDELLNAWLVQRFAQLATENPGDPDGPPEGADKSDVIGTDPDDE